MENLLYNMGFTSQWFQIMWVGFTFIMLLSSCYLIGVLSEKKFLIYVYSNGIFKYPSRLITGWIIEMAIFQLICVPMVIWNAKFSVFSDIYIVVIGVISVLSLLLCRREVFEEERDALRDYKKKIVTMGMSTKWYMLIALILIGVQVFMCIFCVQVSEDSIFDYAISAQTLDHNSMFRTNAYTGYECGLEQYVNRFTNSWYMYRPFLALVFQMHPTVAGKIVLIPVILVVSYICYYFIARALIRDRENEIIFMIFLCLINIFGDLRITSMNMLLISADNGKSVFANIILPIMLCIFIRIYDNHENIKLFIYIALLNVCAVAMSPTALIYSAFAVVIALGVIAFRHKNIKIWMKGWGTILPNIVCFSLYIIQEGWGIWS